MSAGETSLSDWSHSGRMEVRAAKIIHFVEPSPNQKITKRVKSDLVLAIAAETILRIILCLL